MTQIAIFTYDRVKELGEKSIRTLDDLVVDFDQVTIFVASEEQREMYEAAYPYRFVVAKLGKYPANHWALTEHYPRGERVLCMDDDIKSVDELHHGGLRPFSGTIDDLLDLGFELSEREGTRLWGVYPVRNPFYMKDQAVVGLRFIYGAFYGTYAGSAVDTDPERIVRDSGADWESSLRAFVWYKRVLRIEWVTIDQRMFAPGGMTASFESLGVNRKADREGALRDIASRYPDLTTLTTKAGGTMNLRLKSITKKRIPRALLDLSIN
jgi:hypothetical protein